MPVAAESGPQAAAVEEANQLLRKMSYRKALKAVERVILASDSGPAELAEAYRIKGLSLAALNRKADAVKAFRRLLAVEPTFRLPKSISPKLRTPFYQAVGMAVDQAPIGIEHTPPEVGERLGGVRLRARLKADPLKMVFGLRFRYLSQGSVEELSVLVDKPKAVSFKLPDGYDRDTFRYWVEAFNEHGGVLARAGSRSEPFVLKTRPKPKPVVAPVVDTPDPVATAVGSAPPPTAGAGDESATWYRTWWFWTVVGVVVAGAVTGGVLAGTAGGDPDPLHWDIRIR
jgi:hypothetical protein